MHRSVIRGLGSYLPPKKLTNEDLEKLVSTNDEWIQKRTGIRSRSIAGEGVLTSDLAKEASLQALEQAKLKPSDIDMIIFATTTPDTIAPNTACILQNKLGIPSCMAFDIFAACSGWVYGASIADQFIKAGSYKNILVVASEVLHSIINYKDRNTCVLFGDGAGAGIISRASKAEEGNILSFHHHCDGSLGSLILIKAGGMAYPVSQEMIDNDQQYLEMNGQEVYKTSIRAMVNSSQEALDNNHFSASDIDWFVPHQANLRIMEATAKQLGVPSDKVISELPEMGNISSASVPLCLSKASRDGRLQRGQLVLTTVFGSGVTSGSLLFRY